MGKGGERHSMGGKLSEGGDVVAQPFRDIDPGGGKEVFLKNTTVSYVYPAVQPK